jgi:predicted O-methyltransferase YrrM
MSLELTHYVPFLESQGKGNILEIGVRDGESTRAFLAGLSKNGGHLYSIDIKDCSGVTKDDNWSFLQADSRDHEKVRQFVPSTLDVLFIDGDHTQSGYRDDLETYSALVREGGLIISHDIDTTHNYTLENGHPDAPSAKIKDEYFDFIERNNYIHFELPGYAGLGVIVKSKMTEGPISTRSTRVNPFMQSNSKTVLLAFITTHHPSSIPFIAMQRERMKNSPLPYVFVYGDAKSQVGIPDRAPLTDELFFPVNDTKPYMVLKNKALFEWALEHGYDFVFRMAHDTVVYPERIIKNFALLSKHDYAGTMCGYGAINATSDIFTLRYLDYMHGGVGVWLSERAMRMLIADEWKGPYSSPLSKKIEITPAQWFDGSWDIYWDDMWMGEVLKGNLNYNDPKRNNMYENYLVHVLDDPTLFASNTPFDSNKVIATHSPQQMGETNLRPQAFSTRTGTMSFLTVDWEKSKSEFKEIAPLK